MDLAQLLSGLLESLNALQAKLADAEQAAEELAKAKYDEGFAAGVASVVPPVGDKIYSQAELDLAVESAVLPLQEQITMLQGQVDGIPALVDAKVIEAVALCKAELLAKYEAQQAAETSTEASFKDLLNS